MIAMSLARGRRDSSANHGKYLFFCTPAKQAVVFGPPLLGSLFGLRPPLASRFVPNSSEVVRAWTSLVGRWRAAVGHKKS